MKAIKYFTNVLPNGYLSIPPDIKKELALQKGEKLEVILSYITIKSKEDEIKSLQKRIQEDAAKKSKHQLTLRQIDQMVHSIRKS